MTDTFLAVKDVLKQVYKEVARRQDPRALSHQEREFVDVLERDAGTFGHAVQRIFGDMELNVDFVGETFIQTTQQSTAPGEVNAVVNDVGIEFGRCVFKC